MQDPKIDRLATIYYVIVSAPSNVVLFQYKLTFHVQLVAIYMYSYRSVSLIIKSSGG